MPDATTASERVLEEHHRDEVQRGERFEFGENWARFLSVVDDERIAEAERSLEQMLGRGELQGASFLDIGCGSGLFSLAALRLGAARVHSIDFDPSSVACARELRRRFAPASSAWTIEPGSVLDTRQMAALGTFDVVYAWGVLHHTGDMWTAIENATRTVGQRGRLFIAIYNDQGFKSRAWRSVKRLYNALPDPLRTPFAILVMLRLEVGSAARFTLRGKPWRYVQTWTRYKQARGMSHWHDIVDWVGGLPFEVATPDAVFDFCHDRGFELARLVTRQGLGCNEFVFRRA